MVGLLLYFYCGKKGILNGTGASGVVNSVCVGVTVAVRVVVATNSVPVVLIVRLSKKVVPALINMVENIPVPIVAVGWEKMSKG